MLFRLLSTCDGLKFVRTTHSLPDMNTQHSSDDFKDPSASLAETRERASFDYSIDVIVAGAGAAGQCAAMAVADQGRDVWLLERDATPKGSTAMSEGAIAAAGTKSQLAAGVDDSGERFFQDIMNKTHGTVDAEFAKAVAYGSGPTIDWLVETHGLPIAYDPDWEAVYGHTAKRLHKPPSGTGEELISALASAAESAGVTLVNNATLVKAYRGEDGAVTGVCVERPNGDREDIGCGALVLATCGFGANERMIEENIPSMKDAFYWGHEGNDGIGIQIGRALGGAVKYMDAYQGLGLLAKAYGEIVHPSVMFEGGAILNIHGERFENELTDVSGQGARIIAQPEQTGWVVFNERAFKTGMKTPQLAKLNDLGGVKKTSSLEELAGVIGCEAGPLKATLADLDQAAQSNGTCAFGRPFKPTDAPSFPMYAAKVTGALFHTQGGLMVDGHGQVMDATGALLPNLFAAGGTARSISGPGPSGYLPAAGLCMAVTLGRLAGEQAAKVSAKTQS